MLYGGCCPEHAYPTNSIDTRDWRRWEGTGEGNTLLGGELGGGIWGGIGGNSEGFGGTGAYFPLRIADLRGGCVVAEAGVWTTLIKSFLLNVARVIRGRLAEIDPKNTG